MVAVRRDFLCAGSCDVVGFVGVSRPAVVFDVSLEDPALAPGSLGSRDPAFGNIEVQRQPHWPSLQLGLPTCFAAFAARHSLYCMAWSDAGWLDVALYADHRGCLATLVVRFAMVVASIADSATLSSRRLAQVDRDLACEVVGGARYAEAVDMSMLLLPYLRRRFRRVYGSGAIDRAQQRVFMW